MRELAAVLCTRIQRQAIDDIMNLQIETVTTTLGKMDVIRDINTVHRIIEITEKVMASVRDFPCGHKPNGVGGKCQACEALKEWDEL